MYLHGIFSVCSNLWSGIVPLNSFDHSESCMCIARVSEKQLSRSHVDHIL